MLDAHWTLAILDISLYRGADIDSDHYSVRVNYSGRGRLEKENIEPPYIWVPTNIICRNTEE